MKRLLLSIGSIAAVVTPVVAVVSCGDKKEEATAVLQNGQYVDHAFRDHATFANLNGAKALAFTAASTEMTKFEALATAMAAANITLQGALDAIKAFNDANITFKADADFSTDANNSAVLTALKGKKLKAELFFQQDNRGGMTYVNGALTAAQAVEKAYALTDAIKVDNAQHGHAGALHTFSIRMVAA